MKIRFLILLFLITAISSFAQQPLYKLYLVGDAGEDELTGETLDSLKSKLSASPNSAVVFMGDNSYKDWFFGLMPSFKGFDSSRITQEHILSQLDILKDYKGSAFFVPGNHDWWNLTDFNKGRKKLQMEESFIEANLKTNKTIANSDSTFLPRHGTPGPVSVQLNNGKVRVVFIDTFWLILLGYKTNPPENLILEKQFYHNLDSTLAVAKTMKQTVVIVCHHPVYTTGAKISKKLKHPYLFARVKQSYKSFPSYADMSAKMIAILQKYPGVYFASGHLHALQYHTVNGVHYLISGAGSKTNHIKGKEATTPITYNTENMMVWNEMGFFEIDVFKDHAEVILYHEEGRRADNLTQAENAK
jgi:UDP-2,3-diacylglucosamine pyrophosphatase LpxH